MLEPEQVLGLGLGQVRVLQQVLGPEWVGLQQKSARAVSMLVLTLMPH